MKLKEIFFLLGLKPKAKRYGYDIRTFELPKDGSIKYAQWLHPRETEKIVRQDVVDNLRSFLNEGDTAIDIGAHSGDSTIPIALAVGKVGICLAFEPNEYIFHCLRENSTLNSELTNIEAHQFAATPTDGDYTFEYSDSGYCNGGRHEGISVLRHGHTFKLNVVGKNLQDFLTQHYPDRLSRLKYVKIDAEGYDLTILKSIEKLVARHRPFLNLEIFKRTTKQQRTELVEYVRGLGYRIHRVVDDANYRGDLINTENVTNWKHFDVFCIPDNPNNLNT